MLKKGDVVLSFDGKRIENDSHLVSEVSNTEIGRRVTVVVFRNGQQEAVELTVGERPNELTASSRNP